jgi:hypothetical protein
MEAEMSIAYIIDVRVKRVENDETAQTVEEHDVIRPDVLGVETSHGLGAVARSAGGELAAKAMLRVWRQEGSQR